jgi:uracil phosphoribosyltransferase
VPILRSGSAILDTMLDLFPAASVYHLGLYRDKHTLLPTGGVAT